MCSGRERTASYSKNSGTLASIVNSFRSAALSAAFDAPAELRRAATNTLVSITARSIRHTCHITSDIATDALIRRRCLVFGRHLQPLLLVAGELAAEFGALLGEAGRLDRVLFVEGRIGEFVLDRVDALAQAIHQRFRCADLL